MTGDYLRVAKDNLCIKKNTIVEIRGVDADDKLAEKGLIGSTHCRPLDDDQFEGGIWCEYLEPIPLTSEILEKNGFEFGYTASEEDFCSATGCGYPEEKGWCYDEGAGEIKIIFPNETDGGLIRLDDQCVDKHLELVFVKHIMVHELQHYLKLVGIEKEIQL